MSHSEIVSKFAALDLITNSPLSVPIQDILAELRIAGLRVEYSYYAPTTCYDEVWVHREFKRQNDSSKKGSILGYVFCHLFQKNPKLAAQSHSDFIFTMGRLGNTQSWEISGLPEVEEIPLEELEAAATLFDNLGE